MIIRVSQDNVLFLSIQQSKIVQGGPFVKQLRVIMEEVIVKLEEVLRNSIVLDLHRIFAEDFFLIHKLLQLFITNYMMVCLY